MSKFLFSGRRQPTQTGHRLPLTDRLVPYGKQTLILANQLALPAKRSY